MNELRKLILRVLVTLVVVTVVSFGILHYVPLFKDSLFGVYAILIVVSTPGISLSFWFYSKGSIEDVQKLEIPLKSEEEIFQQLTRDKEDKPTETPATSEPIVIPPTRMLVPLQSPGEAIKTVMQNKVIEALQRCKVNVDIKADMSLDGEFKDPKITVAFVTTEEKKTEAPTKPEPKKPEKETLGPPRV
jgi:hypothetical protein